MEKFRKFADEATGYNPFLEHPLLRVSNGTKACAWVAAAHQTLGLVLFALRLVLLVVFGAVYGLLSVVALVVPLAFFRDLVHRSLLGILMKVVGFFVISANTSHE